MKQIIAIIPSEKVLNIIKKLENHVGGFSVWSVKGTGKGHLAAAQSARSTGRFVPEFYSYDIVFLVYDDSKVNSIIYSIKNAVGTGLKGEGKIFVSDIEEAHDVGSNKKDSKII